MEKEAKLIFGVFLVMTLLALSNTVDCEPIISDLAIDIGTKEETETDFFTIEQHTWVTRRKRVSDDITAYVDFPASMDVTFNFIDKDVKLRLKRNEYMTTNVRLTDESGPIQHDLKRKTAIYSDLEKRASFVVRCDDFRKDCTLRGSMERDGKMWTISPDPLQPMLHMAVKNKKDRRILFGSDTPPIPGVQTVEKHTDEKVTKENWSRPNPRFLTSRHKRAIPTNCSIVECIAIADESIWAFFMNITGSNVTAAEEELTQYYMELYAQADLHYDKVSERTEGVCLRLYLAAVHIQKTRSESWSAPAEFPQQAARPYVNAVTGMLRCGVQGNAFRQTYSLDLYQCFTRKDLLWNEKGGTLYYAYHRGLSFMSTACQVNRYIYASSVIESYGDKVELIIAREIAHALGADHDSKSGCDDDDGYIMANEVAVNEDKLKLRNIWYFSTCTLTQMVSHLATVPSCLTDNGFNATAYDAFKFAPLAGATNSWEEQCVLKFEVGSVKCDPTGQNRTYIDHMCESNIYCTAPNGTCTAAGRPYDGTPCGDLNAYCSYGKCYIPPRQLGIICSCHADCSDSNSTCNVITGVCECREGFYDDNGTNSIGGACQPKVLVGDLCPQNDACIDPNAFCDSGRCVCLKGYYNESDACALLKYAGENCTESYQCNGENVECSGSPFTCRCPSDRYLEDSSGNCVPKLDLGSNCTDGQCGPANSVCDSTTNTCECQDGFFDTNGTSAGGDCLAKVALYAACSQPDSCSDPNAVCSTTCNCSSDYFDNNGTCQPLRCVGETCSAASDCRAQNVECTGTPPTCRCPADRYLDLSSGNCVTKLDLGSNCTDGQCGPTNSVCDSTTNNCECQNGFFDTNGTSAGGDCSSKVALYAACSQPDSCSDSNAVCSTTCNCSSDYFDNNGTCQHLRCVGETCSATSDCRAQNVECTGSPLTCRCPADRYLDLSSGNCVTKLDLGSNCTDGQCGPANSVCDSTTANCECQDGFFDTNGTSASGDCLAKVALYAACSQPDSCSDPNAVCSTTCNCSSDYFDNNGTCQPLRCVGETCSAASDCRAQNVECAGTTLTCRCPADRYLDVSSGDCVTKFDLGSNCTDGQCGPANSVCDSTTTYCECQDGFFDTNGTSAGGDCSAKVSLYAACSQPDSCSDPNAVCSMTCNCSSDYFDKNGTCQPLRCVGETCSAASDCRAQNVECAGVPRTCRCPANRYLDLSSGDCFAKLDLGYNCTDGQCGPANSVCDSTTTTCECQDGFFDTNGTSAGGDCSAKVALYAACSQPDSCSDQNAVCSTTCNCSSDYFDNNGTCQTLKCVGETCSAASECRAQNVECSGMPPTCRCPTDRFLDLSSGYCVAKLDLGSNCTDGQCGPANSVCDSTTTNCECQDGFFDTNGTSAGGDCSAKVYLYAACSQPDSCSDPNAVCSTTCNCSSDYFDNNGTCQPLRCVGETCSAASDCRARNADCSGMPPTCRCPTDRYLDLSLGDCVAKLDLGSNCTDGQCGPANSVCDSTTSDCKCQDGFFDTNGTSAGGDCSAKVALYAACSQPDSCSDPNAVCSSTCNCSSDYFDNNGTCQPLRCVGETCSAASDCRAQNVECAGTTLTCRCPADRYLDLSSGNCVTKLDLGSNCIDGQCGPANSVCDSTTTNCECQDGFFDTNGTSAGGDCSAKVDLYAACSQQDSCSDPNAVCSTTCNCSSDYFDNNGTCQPLRCVGETCSAASDCRAQNVECAGTTPTCRCPVDRYLDLTSGNCVTTTNTCECQDGFFDTNGATAGGDCSAKVALYAACSQPDSCSDPNAVCSTTCNCSSNYFDNNGMCQPLRCVGETCSATSDCRAQNVECAGTPLTCRCPADRYLDLSSGNCVTKLDLGSNCTDGQCGPAYSVCDSTTTNCECQDGFFDTNGTSAGGECSAKVALYAACSQPDSCSDPNAVCSTTCNCSSDYFDNNGTCQPLRCVGETCSAASDCRAQNVECTGSPPTCRCPADRYLDLSSGNCVAKKELNASCEIGQCKDEFSVCYPTTSRCQCIDGYEVSGTMCSLGNVTARCPDGWVSYGGSCYLFTHDSVNFAAADNYCRQLDAYLVHMNTVEENLWVQSFCGELKSQSFWIGLTDIETEGTWKWQDTNETVTFTDWYPGEPNRGTGENCAALYQPVDFKWVDIVCTATLTPLCEQKSQS